VKCSTIFGFTTRTLTPEECIKFEIDSSKEYQMITSIENDSIALISGLKIGDILIGIYNTNARIRQLFDFVDEDTLYNIYGNKLFDNRTILYICFNVLRYVYRGIFDFKLRYVDVLTVDFKTLHHTLRFTLPFTNNDENDTVVSFGSVYFEKYIDGLTDVTQQMGGGKGDGDDKSKSSAASGASAAVPSKSQGGVVVGRRPQSKQVAAVQKTVGDIQDLMKQTSAQNKLRQQQIQKAAAAAKQQQPAAVVQQPAVSHDEEALQSEIDSLISQQRDASSTFHEGLSSILHPQISPQDIDSLIQIYQNEAQQGSSAQIISPIKSRSSSQEASSIASSRSSTPVGSQFVTPFSSVASSRSSTPAFLGQGASTGQQQTQQTGLLGQLGNVAAQDVGQAVSGIGTQDVGQVVSGVGAQGALGQMGNVRAQGVGQAVSGIGTQGLGQVVSGVGAQGALGQMGNVRAQGVGQAVSGI
ncbi:MAG: hypothetical protein EB023_13795, partial [Flavobacteriia bacterium]|nr:hypothetical protein [Flavobacteriia bacterium]